MKLNQILTDYFCQQNNINIDAPYKIEEVDAVDLLVPERIDLIAKWKYIEYREKGFDLSYIKELYTSHIEAFSNGSYTEPGNEDKDSIEKYFKTFNHLIDTIKKNGIDKSISVIPVGQNNVIIDGAHRVAIAAYLNLKVPIIRFENLAVDYGVGFFKTRLLNEKYIDYLVAEYCNFKNNLYFACVWPRAKGDMQMENTNTLLNQSCKVLYSKRIKLSHDGLRNLIIQIYSHQDWIGHFSNHFSGALHKADECYDSENFLTIYILECNSFDKILKLKSEIREIFKIGNHSIHITDNQKETIQLAHILLNRNSIEFLNQGKPDYYLEFNKKLESFKKKLLAHNFFLDQFIIDSSSTLALYGLRDVNDIDFMTVSREYEVIEDDINSNHHSYIHFYETTIDDLVLNPDNYFIYNDVKFVTLNTLRVFKKNRNEGKDQLDIKLIDSVLTQKQSFKLRALKIQTWRQRKIRNFKYYIIRKLAKLFKKIGIYKNVKELYLYLIANRK